MKARKILIVGDLLVDTEISGTRRTENAEWIDASTCSVRPGGAGLAALLAAQTGDRVTLISACGPGEPSFSSIFRSTGVTYRSLIPEVEPARKVRIFDERGRVVAVSFNPAENASSFLAGRVTMESVAILAAAADGILVSDYGCGTLGNPVLRGVLAQFASKVPLVWDPHPRGSPPVVGTRTVTPNEHEWNLINRRTSEWSTALLDFDVLVTMGENGANLILNGAAHKIGTESLAGWPDTTGAGDACAVALLRALIDGVEIVEASHQAVQSATRFVAQGGVHGEAFKF